MGCGPETAEDEICTRSLNAFENFCVCNRTVLTNKFS